MRGRRGTVNRREVLKWMGGGAFLALQGGCGEGPPPARLPPPSGPLHYESLLSVAARIEAGEVSPVALAESLLARIETLEPRLHAYITLMADTALAAAGRAEGEIRAGRYRGPLHGVPLAVKDLCYTRGVRTTGGLAVLRDFVPDYDATVVQRLEGAGAVLLGKLNLTEGAMGGYHPDFELPRNPWGEALWPGASSSGSGVATAAGLCFGSLGTDTGGSIRFPSHANGVVGLKPSYGRVSRHGVIPLAASLDHVGPMTRRVADAAAMLEVIAGPDPADSTSMSEPAPDLFTMLDAGVKGLRIGYDEAFATEGVPGELAAAMEAALGTLAAMGAEIVDVTMPEGSQSVGDPWFVIAATEALDAHRAFYPERAAEFGAYFRDFLAFGAGLTEEQIAGARAFRADYTKRLDVLLESVDAVACAAGGATFELDVSLQRGGFAEFEALMPSVKMHQTIPADIAGTPALTLPCGFTDDGRPLGMQFMGRRGGEAMLCRIGHAYEAATAWHRRHPPV